MTDRRVYTGRQAAPGVGLGLLHRTDRPVPRALPDRPQDAPDRQIDGSFDAVADGLMELSASLRERGRRDEADIMEVNALIAQDGDLREEAIARARRGVPVPIAIHEAVETYARTIAGLDDPTLAERAADVRQVGRRVLTHLHGDTGPAPDQPLVLVAHEIGAADLLEPGRTVTGAVSVTGGPNSHAAIVARAQNIPFVLAVDAGLLDQADGQEILLDGEQEHVVVRPAEGERAMALAAMNAARIRREALAAERHLPAETLDGRGVGLLANAATVADVRAAVAAGADVGLLRTELPFLSHPAWPTGEEHSAVLAPVMRALAGRAVTARTLDFADDKLPPFLLPGARQGRIGRGLPLMLARPDAFTDQLRSLLRAGTETDLRIMIPMVADVRELRACRRLLHRAADDTGVAPPPLGVMVELPEAVAAADDLAREADFFSIGSNDLTCQVLRLDRRSPDATPAMAAHPAVLDAIAATVAAAHRHGRQVSVCGDAAAHPLVVPLLIGLGCDSLSVAPAALDDVRARIRRLDSAACGELAGDALGLETAADVWRLVRDQCAPALP